MQTCWKQMAPFHTIAATVKRKYTKASKVTLAVNSIKQDDNKVKQQQKQNKKRSQMKQQKLVKKKLKRKKQSDDDDDSGDLNDEQPPGKGDLVFIEKSPNFCKKSRYSWGTEGRVCDRGVDGSHGDCGVLCCGRGYNTIMRTVDKPCNCSVVWCCEVKCLTCPQSLETHTCK